MKTRMIVAAAVVLLLGSSAGAQSLAELLQKGIYTQDTLGDTDAAIRIYQQVVAGAAAQSELRAQAQRRLRAAEMEHGVMMAERAAKEGRGRFEEALRRAQGAEPPATFDGRTYRHTWTGLTFTVPDGWTVHATGPSSDGGEGVSFTPADPAAFVAVWMKKEDNDPDTLGRLLDEAPFKKLAMRTEYRGYQLREGSVQRVTVGGQQGTVAIADYIASAEPGTNRRMVEYMTWIYTANTHVFFQARLPAVDLERLRPQFDAMVYSAIIP